MPNARTLRRRVPLIDASITSVLVALGALWTLLDVVRALRGDSMTVHGLPVTVAPDAAGVGTAAAQAIGDVTIAGLPSSARLLLLTTPTLAALMSITGVVLLLQVLRQISAGHPFTSANVRRLRIIGLLLLTWAAALPSLGMLLTMIALTDRSEHISFAAEYSPFPLLACVAAFAIAGSFERGRALEDDTEGLV